MLIVVSSDDTICLRAARRYGHIKGESFDDVLRLAVPDPEYQTGAWRKWHKLKDQALELLPQVLCKVCRSKGVERGRETCSDRCRDIMACEADYAAARCQALTSKVRHSIVERALSRSTPARIALSVGLELERVCDILEGYQVLGVPITLREQQQLERGWDEGLNTRSIGRALNISTRITEAYFQANPRPKVKRSA